MEPLSQNYIQEKLSTSFDRFLSKIQQYFTALFGQTTISNILFGLSLHSYFIKIYNLSFIKQNYSLRSPHSQIFQTEPMLQSPLRRGKLSYPLDFSIKKKEVSKNPIIKYDFITDQQNPEKNMDNHSEVHFKKSQVSDLFIQTANNRNQKQYTFEEDSLGIQNEKKSNINSQLQEMKILQINSFRNQYEDDEPLIQVKRKHNLFHIDQNLLKNPRIQINEEKTINSSKGTLQTQAAINKVPNNKVYEIGGIKHQDLKFMEMFENQKQIPLLPERPFDQFHKNVRRDSLINKMKLDNYKSNHFSEGQLQNNLTYSNVKFASGQKYFRPETYNYANNLFQNKKQTLIESNVRRANSSFDVSSKKQKIIYINSQNHSHNTYNLPNLSFSRGPGKVANTNLTFAKDFQSRVGDRLHFRERKRLPFKVNKGSAFGSHFQEQNKERQQNLGSNQDFSRQNVGGLYSLRNNRATQRNQRFEHPSGRLNEISKLKAEINFIAQQRFRNKSEFNGDKNTSQAQRQFTFQDQESRKFNQIKLKQSPNKGQNLKNKNVKRLQITYHVPLISLKQICKKYLSNQEAYRLAFKVPKIFMEKYLFMKSQEKQQLHQNALTLFDSLRISSKNLVIKRYSNCIIFGCGHITVVWYYNGKRYLGGWQYEYLDEGSRHGLGLEWQPNSYIYYGQFRNNKKHGLGAIKEGPEQVLVGYWYQGKHIGTRFKEQQQNLSQESSREDQEEQNFNGTGENEEFQSEYRQ